MRAVAALQGKGVKPTHYHISTLKPFDHPDIMQKIAESRYGAITLENHSIIGGLGSIVAEQMAESGIGKKLRRLGLQDTFAHGASRRYLMREYGLDAATLIATVENMLNEKFGITENDLADTYTPAVHSGAKPEAL